MARFMWLSGVVLLLGAGVWLYAIPHRPEVPPLVVHEWGTFTSLQDERGRTLRGINTDDEPVPPFVHRLSRHLLTPQRQLAPIDLRFARFSKGLPALPLRDVAMRLETPVAYFYPPDGVDGPMSVDVRVGFHGGLLSEFYPRAVATAPGVTNARAPWLAGIDDQSVGELRWDGLIVGATGELPATDDPVWTTPRLDSAARVATADGKETEAYLFYRGVGNLEAPVRVTRDGSTLTIRSALPSPNPWAGAPEALRTLWLVDVRADGALAFRTIPVTPADDVIARAPADFADGGYDRTNLAPLRQRMHAALVADGLYADEADAMLGTWEHAYFKTPGLRLFYLVPKAWTDRVLPLTVDAGERPVHIERTMVGRVELVTPEQRTALDRLAQADVTPPDWIRERMAAAAPDDDAVAQLYARLFADESFDRLGVEPPADYQAYLDLGRFRNALLLDAVERTGDAKLKAFADTWGLRLYDAADVEAAMKLPLVPPTVDAE